MICPMCDGEGKVDMTSVADNMDVYQLTCNECNGTGEIVSELLYCCVCKADTPHIRKDGLIFDYGLECLVCNILWEAVAPGKENK